MSGPGSWRTLRRKIDIGRWIAPPPADERFVSPRILTVAKFAPAPVCDWLIAASREKLGPADLYDPQSGVRVRHKGIRNNSVASFALTEQDVILVMLRARIAALAGVALADLEPPMVLNYQPGQAFGPHFDYLDPEQPALAPSIVRFGQRVATFLLYLNEDYEGGETDFPDLGWRYRGAKGDALLFWSAEADGSLNRQTRHAGLTPTSGEKWVLSQWIRRRAV
jgi:prolyl 4-hydroxylase